MPIRLAQPADIPSIARIHVDNWRATYAGLMPDDFLANLTYEEREEIWGSFLTTPDQWLYVAEDSEIIGFAACGPEREGDPIYKGQFYSIHVRANTQGKGIGRALVQAGARQLLQAGITSMLIWVLVDNPARAFYEALGGQYLYEKRFPFGDAMVLEVAYGWRNLQQLIDAS